MKKRKNEIEIKHLESIIKDYKLRDKNGCLNINKALKIEKKMKLENKHLDYCTLKRFLDGKIKI